MRPQTADNEPTMIRSVSSLMPSWTTERWGPSPCAMVVRTPVKVVQLEVGRSTTPVYLVIAWAIMPQKRP
jgi:hypothetical protein